MGAAAAAVGGSNVLHLYASRSALQYFQQGSSLNHEPVEWVRCLRAYELVVRKSFALATGDSGTRAPRTAPPAIALCGGVFMAWRGAAHEERVMGGGSLFMVM